MKEEFAVEIEDSNGQTVMAEIPLDLIKEELEPSPKQIKMEQEVSQDSQTQAIAQDSAHLAVKELLESVVDHQPGSDSLLTQTQMQIKQEDSSSFQNPILEIKPPK